jgi:hypothetical protein
VNVWAETTVKAKGNPRQDYPPVEGEECARCQRELRRGERVFRLCKVDEIRVNSDGTDAWVCESCLPKGDPACASQPVDEWPYPDEEPPDPL